MVIFGGAKVQLFFNVTQGPRYFFINHCIPANIGCFVSRTDGLPRAFPLPFLPFFLKKSTADFAVTNAFFQA